MPLDNVADDDAVLGEERRTIEVRGQNYPYIFDFAVKNTDLVAKRITGICNNPEIGMSSLDAFSRLYPTPTA